jgi:hypothetical protein
MYVHVTGTCKKKKSHIIYKTIAVTSSYYNHMSRLDILTYLS